MSLKIDLDQNKFSTFYAVTKVISNCCYDLIIKDGIVRQLENSKHYFYQFDLTGILGNNFSVVLNDIKSLNKALDPFIKQKSEMIIELTDDMFYIGDNDSRIEKIQGEEAYSANKNFNSETMLNKLEYGKEFNNQTIFKTQLNRKLLDRLSSFAESVQSTSVNLLFENSKVSFNLKAMLGNNKPSTTIRLCEVPTDLDLVGETHLSVIPFSINSSTIDIEFFTRETAGTILAKISSLLGYNKDISFEAWGACNLVDEKDEGNMI